MSLTPKVLLAMCFIVACESRSNGAPSKACKDMTPQHRNSVPQELPSPFVVDIIPLKDKSSSISVKISHPNNDKFKGFMIQAHNNDNKEIILHGTFSSNELVQQPVCEGGTGTYATHKSAETKTLVQTTWIPPPYFEGNITFRTTIVKEYNTYWVGIESESIFVSSTLTTADHSTMTTTDHSTMTTTESGKQTQLETYKDCSVNQGCFGLPDGCLANSNCRLLLSYKPQVKFVDFQLIGMIEPDSGWIAVGFSEDQKMGDDSVTECIYYNGEYKLQQSWNVATKPPNNVKINNPQGSIIKKTDQRYENGKLLCRWEQDYETEVKQHTFNLSNKTYYLLLAMGPTNNNGEKERHSDTIVSATKVDITKISLVEGKSLLLVKIHGSFMVVAWLSFVSIGILLARYYKQVWEGSTLCRTKIWFAFHRAIMLLGVALIIAAFVAIFLYEKGWSEAYPHSILGCITTGLSLIQVVAGLARPNPNSSKRQVFNWLHWLNGNFSQILAIITIFFSIQLQKLKLPRYCYWVLIGYIAFHLIFHLTMQFHSCCMDRKTNSDDIKLHQLGQKREMEVIRDAPGGGFRRFMLGIYIVTSSAIVTALVLIICLHPTG